LTSRVRPAQIEDAPAIVAMVEALAEYEKLREACRLTREDVEREIVAPEAPVQCLIAEVDGQPVGLAIYFYNFSTFLGRRGLYLEDLFVLPEFRGHGLGKALLRAIARQAVREGLGRVEWAVLDWNQPSIDFYRSLGAVPMDEWTTFRLAGEALAEFGAA
jgi:GNAT superfamily N-acetyltransferase